MKPAEQGVLPITQPQFRMRELQLYNWGTFSGIHRLNVAERGFLVVGKSGAGKSTLLDAITALLVPPKWATYNLAARDEKGRDRNLLSYVRGAWAEQQDTDSGDIVKRYLRPNTTWTAVVLNYDNGAGQRVALAQVMWIRGQANASNELHRRYLTLERALDIRELEGFGANLDVRKLKQSLPDAQVREEFKGYSERFCGLLGIENEMALRLLHKTQSAKSLGDLNTLLRDFMLERPETFAGAERLVNEFGELNAAHGAVVTARKQVAVLDPARVSYRAMEGHQRTRNALQDLRVGVKPYRVMRRTKLLEERIAGLQADITTKTGEISRADEVYQNHKAHLDDLQRQHSQLGGDAITRWEEEKRELAEERLRRGQKLAQVQASCQRLGRTLADTPGAFTDLVAACRHEIEERQAQVTQDRERWVDLDRRRVAAEETFAALASELKSLTVQKTSIPGETIALRDSIASAIKVKPSGLPFVGELVEVKPDEQPWQGAIERVLRGFALSILVEEANYNAFSRHVNERDLRARISYYRTDRRGPQPQEPAFDSLVRKLELKQGSFAPWLTAELRQRFDLHCVDTIEAFQSADRALTKQGQIKNRMHHQKDDRHPVGDRKRWVLGFDNAQKRALFEKDAADAAAAVAVIQREINAYNDRENDAQQRIPHCHTLVNIQWREIDVLPLIERVKKIDEQIERAKEGNVSLKKISEQIDKHLPNAERAAKALATKSRERDDLIDAAGKLQGSLDKIRGDPSVVAPTPFQIAGLDMRFADKKTTLDNLDAMALDVSDALHEEIQVASEAITGCEKSIEATFVEFRNSWPSEASDMDVTVASAPDYFAKLERLEKDGLPAHEKRFFELLNSQSHQNLAALLRYISQARKEIIDRMESVNESLAKAPFNVGTYLEIRVVDKQLQSVREFRKSIQEAIADSMTDDREAAEARFVVLKQIVDRLGSQESDARRWCDQVLDVRQHVEFIAIERNSEGEQVEIYRSGAGKSGGQRQKLATTCLAAALRYQLGSSEQGLPIYAAVVLDEAFDKADNEFTALAMNIFAQFGFQMIVATPLKSVMTLEPFIGGACYVEIKDRNASVLFEIQYDEASRKLKLPARVRETSEIEDS